MYAKFFVMISDTPLEHITDTVDTNSVQFWKDGTLLNVPIVDLEGSMSEIGAKIKGMVDAVFL